MAKFNSFSEAETAMNDSLIEINEILARDLPELNEKLRSVDMWFQIHGKNRELDLTKDLLRELEMKAIDAEIFLLNEADKKSRMADTVC